MKKTVNPNQRIDYEILGYGGLLSPFGGAFNSSQRAMMYSSHLGSYLTPIRAEFPDIFSGFELLFGDYCYQTFEINEPIEIIKVIPKFRKLPVEQNPMLTIIYRKLNSNELDYANVYRYIRTSETYGFLNSFDKVNMIREGAIFDSGEELVYPLNKDPDTGEYRMGVNANVAYMTLLDTYEDSFVISESLAKKLNVIQIEICQFEIDFDKYPLNIYGDDDNYKVFPDIGEQINDDGIIAAFRKIDKRFITIDLSKPRLKIPNFIHDKIEYGRPNATIIDIDVFMDRKIKLLKVAYDQFRKYSDYKLEYYQDVFDVYIKNKQEKISPKLNTLFTDAIKFLLAANVKLPGVYSKSKNIHLQAKNTPVKLLTRIIYVYELEVGEGFKLTGRDGAKGIICKVLPDKYMPVDKHGIKVDIIMDANSVSKRTNISQLFEQFFTRASMLLLKRIENQDNQTKFNTIIDFLKDVNPEYAEIVYNEYSNNIDEFIRETYTNGLKIWIRPSSKQITIDNVLHIANKWKIEPSELIFYYKDENGNFKQDVTKEPIFVGSKYIYLLYNLPKINTISIGITNQYDVPTKAVKQKKFGINITPTRFFGEDESRIVVNTSYPDEFTRLRCLQAFSREGLKKLSRELLTSKQPTNIKRIDISTQELKETSTILHALNTFYELLGIDIKHSIVPKELLKQKEEQNK